MIGAIYKFLLGDRIYKALMDELDHGSKVIAVFVLLCVTGTPIMGMLRLLAKLIYG